MKTLMLLTIAAGLAVAQTNIAITISEPPKPKQLVEVIPVPADWLSLTYKLGRTPAPNTLLLVFFRGAFAGAFAPAGPDPKILEIALPAARQAGDAVTVVYVTSE